MTVGEGTEHTVSGVTATPRGFNYDDYSNPYGALADEDFVHDSDVYEIANLAANPQYGDNAGGVTLIFDSGITNAQRNALILEFAGETLPLADVTASDNNGNYWNAAWVATNASSLTLANYRTTLPAGGTVNVWRTSTQVCPGGTTTDPVWSTTMTVEVHTGSTVAWGYGLYNYGGTPDPSQNYGSLDDTTFTLGTNDFAISKLEARDSTNSLNENVFLRIEGTGLTDPTGLTLEWGGAELSLDDTSSASSGAFYMATIGQQAAQHFPAGLGQYPDHAGPGQHGQGVPAHLDADLPGHVRHRHRVHRRDAKRPDAGGRQHRDRAVAGVRPGDRRLYSDGLQPDHGADADGGEERQQCDGGHHERRRLEHAGRGGAGSQCGVQHADGDGDGAERRHEDLYDHGDAGRRPARSERLPRRHRLVHHDGGGRSRLHPPQ